MDEFETPNNRNKSWILILDIIQADFREPDLRELTRAGRRRGGRRFEEVEAVRAADVQRRHRRAGGINNDSAGGARAAPEDFVDSDDQALLALQGVI